jgi:L-ascorbate metabolism protein UlaG (beta-lactamase superfamily)
MKTHAALIAEIDGTQVNPGTCACWWLGQHGFAVKLGETIVYIDPFLSALERRSVPPLLRPEELGHADIVLGSHDHADHIDRAAWPVIAAAAPGVTFVTPKLLQEHVADELGLPRARVLGVDRGINVEIAGVRINGVPAAHELLDADEQTGLHPCIGFVIEGNGVCLYHAGDTCIYEGMQALLRQWQFNVAFLPINGRDARRLSAGCIGNMTYQEAADLAGSLKPGVTIPCHFEMFAMNSEDPQLFVDYMHAKYPSLQTLIPTHGERLWIE